MKLTKSERVLLFFCLQIQDTQRQILEGLGKSMDDPLEASDVPKILEVLDVLDMYQAIGQARSEIPDDKEVKFRGFHQHHESRHLLLLRLAVFHLGYCPELKPNAEESEAFAGGLVPKLPQYKRMVEVWRGVKDPDNLTREDILAILKAADENHA